jgi:hypothetical protein
MANFYSGDGDDGVVGGFVDYYGGGGNDYLVGDAFARPETTISRAAARWLAFSNGR